MASEFDSGYTSALTQLQNKLRQDAGIKGVMLDRVIQHIQDLIKRCPGCGGWLFSDGSCLACEQLKAVFPAPKKAVKKK
jgi:hypothetical protein